MTPEKAGFGKQEERKAVTGQFKGITKGQIGIKRKDGTILMVTLAKDTHVSDLMFDSTITATIEKNVVTKIDKESQQKGGKS